MGKLEDEALKLEIGMKCPFNVPTTTPIAIILHCRDITMHPHTENRRGNKHPQGDVPLPRHDRQPRIDETRCPVRNDDRERPREAQRQRRSPQPMMIINLFKKLPQVLEAHMLGKKLEIPKKKLCKAKDPS